MKTIGIICSCDTKHKEAAFMKQCILKEGMAPLVINVATGPGPSYEYDIPREVVALAGGQTWSELEEKSKGEKIGYMQNAAAVYAEQLYREAKIDGILAVGGLQNTVMATNAMRRLPIGFPKVMATTVACGKRLFESVVGESDITVIPSICDFTGLNFITECIIANACACCAGMVRSAGRTAVKSGKKTVGITLMGITNEGACAAIEELEKNGIEAIGFHSTGVGGVIMERMACEGLLDGVLDLTVHEITENWIGGGFSYSEKAAGRLSQMIEHKVPLVICPGGLDFVDFAVGDFPPRMEERVYMMHNASMAHIKILPDEARQVAEIMTAKLEKIDYPVKMLLPTEGMRHNTRSGELLCCKEVDDILLNSIRSVKNPYLEIIEISGNLDTKAWGIQAAREMMEIMK